MSEGLPASRLDYITLVAERPERPFDIAALLTLNADAPSAEALTAGARDAYRVFPRTAARLEADRWVPRQAPPPRFEAHPEPEELRAWVEAEVQKPIDPCREAPLQQIVFQSVGKTTLLVRCHHAVADGLSMLWWVDHQLRIARGERPAADLEAHAGPIELLHHDDARRKNRFAFAGPSRSLWRRREKASRRRRYRHLLLDADRIRAAIGPRGPRGFSYNDLLAAAALSAARGHQAEHQAPIDRLSLWFPVDVRARPFHGFGNGASRVRIYDRAAPGTSMSDGAKLVRENLEAARAEGEWYVPTDHPLFSMPDWLLLAYLRRPWVDMGSLLFSHVERASRAGEDFLRGVLRVETIANLDLRHPLGIAALTLRGQTHLSFTWDPGQLDDADMNRFIELYREAIEQGEGELSA